MQVRIPRPITSSGSPSSSTASALNNVHAVPIPLSALSSLQSSELDGLHVFDRDNTQPKSYKRKRENHDGTNPRNVPVIIMLSDDECEGPVEVDPNKNLLERNKTGSPNWPVKIDDSDQQISISPKRTTTSRSSPRTAGLETKECDGHVSIDTVQNDTNVTPIVLSNSFSDGQEFVPDSPLPTPVVEMVYSRAKLESEILAMFPEICRDFIQDLVGPMATDFGPDKLQKIVLAILENANYPRYKSTPSSATTSTEADKAAGNVSNAEYVIAVKSALRHEFRTMPVKIIDECLHKNKLSLSKAYNDLDQIARYFMGDTSTLPSKPSFLPLRAARSAKVEMDTLLDLKLGRHVVRDLDAVKEQFRVERLKEAEKRDKEFAARLAEKEAEELGLTMTCGCCFGDYADFEMSQCSEGHLFCQACIQRQIENIIGLKQYNLKCIEVGGCEGVFVKSEIKRFMPEKLLEVLDKNQQQAELLESGLELDQCPLCDFAICIENEAEKEFRCQNPECLAVTCRKCGKKSHIPQSCAEYERELAKEDGLTARHQVEEAMTQALLRQCTRCRQRFFKEDGCNKMTCSNCLNTMCYVCNQPIVGYDHFNQGGSYINGKCPLYDDTRKRHQEEIARAENAASQQVLRENSKLYEEDVVVPDVRFVRTRM
ncbi:uncharacterized protein V1513DRAFT_432495 [Lipomyces chichibuensis]|uniref:uncharacterized protein n=1 Tax=Lipomyces chichibuensis TaxID=1546026 RepID=UPI0033432616